MNQNHRFPLHGWDLPGYLHLCQAISAVLQCTARVPLVFRIQQAIMLADDMLLNLPALIKLNISPELPTAHGFHY